MAQLTSTTTSNNQSASGNYALGLYSVMALFFMMGFITCLNDILIPYLKILFQLNYTEVMLINTCFFGAYFFMSIPSGKIIQRVGYKKSMIIGFIIAGIGCLLFYPAAGLKVYSLFLLALFILATGITLLQVTGNPYVSILGDANTASSRLTLSQAFNSVGTTIAPLLGTYFILKNLPEIPAEIRGVSDYTKLSSDALGMFNSFLTKIDASYLQYTYVVIAVVLLIIASIVFILKLPVISAEGSSSENGSAWSFKHLRLGALGIFAYVGAEVAIGSFLVNYFGLKEVAGIPEQEAGNYVAFYWGGAMVGRFLGAYLLKIIKPYKILTFNAVMAIVLVAASITSSGSISMWTILAVGFFNSVMFATIFTLAISDLGKYTNQGSGILCTAIVGGAVIPLLQGTLADSIGLKWAFLIPVLCYLYIVWYAIKGNKHKKIEVK